MKKFLLVGTLVLAASTAHAGPWWAVYGANNECAPIAYSPFAFAEQLRRQGWSDVLTTAYGSTYGVSHAGMSTTFFTSQSACQEILALARSQGIWP